MKKFNANKEVPDCYGGFFDDWSSECIEAPNCWYCDECEKLSIQKRESKTVG